MVANSSHQEPSRAPLTITSLVSGRTTARVTSSPPSRQAMVADHSDQASRVRDLGRMPPRVGGARYGTVTAIARSGGDEHVLELGVVLQGVGAELAADAGLLEAAEG